MTDRMKEAWMDMMKAKYNTDEAGVRKIMSDRQKKGMASPKRKGKPHVAGFSNSNIASQAGKKSKRGQADLIDEANNT